MGWAEECIVRRRPDATLADMLEPALAATPDKTAIIFEGEEISYRDLNHAANRVANTLIGSGVEPGDRVAVQIGNRP